MSESDLSKKRLSRRELLRGLGGIVAGVSVLPILSACGSAPAPSPTAAPKAAEPTKAAAAAAPAPTAAPAVVSRPDDKIVSIVGNPGLHQEVWKEWTKMIADDTKGAIQVKYEPLGYSPSYAKIKTEADADHYTIDIFYADAPWPEKLGIEGNLEALPYDQMPNTKELWDYARRKFSIEVFHDYWGVVGWNTKFVKDEDIKTPATWEAFADPKWKGKLGWPDLRAFPNFMPALLTVYKDNWLDYLKRVDKNVSTYYGRWVDERMANQKGDIWLSPHSMGTIYIGANVDKAPMKGMLISDPKPAVWAQSVSHGLVKNAPHRDNAIKVLDLTSSAKYTKVLMDKGLNPSNNPKNFPHDMPAKDMEANQVAKIGVTKWEDLSAFSVGNDWGPWLEPVDKAVKQWEEEVLKKR